MKKYIDKSNVDGLVQIGWSGDAIVTAIINDVISSVPAIPLDKIKQARGKIENLRLHKAKFITSDNKVCVDSETVLEILDELIESEE